MNNKHYALYAIILFLGVVTNVSKAACPSESLSDVLIVIESKSVLPSSWKIECKNDSQWIITSSDHPQPMVFSLDEMTRIISSMHGDGQAAVLMNNDYRPLMQHMIENNIQPQSVLAGLSCSSESSGEAASAAASSSRTHDYDSIRARIQSLRGLMRSGVTIRSVKSQSKWISKSGVTRLSLSWAPDFIKHQDAQINGNISKLEAALRSAKPGTREYRVIEFMLKARITQELNQILKSPSSDGEAIVAQIKERWPYCEREVSQGELPAIQKHLEKVLFNEYQAACRALTMRKKAERYQAALMSGDSTEIKAVQAQLKADIAQEKNNTKQAELQRLCDRLQAVIDHPNFDRLVALKKAVTLEEAYLICTTPGMQMSTDMSNAMRHIWSQKEGAIDFARLPEVERDARMAAYQAQEVAQSEFSTSPSQLASDFLNKEFGIAPDRYLNFTGTAAQLKNHAVIQKVINNQVSYLHQSKTIEEQGIWAVALQSNVAAFKQNESEELQGATLTAQSLDQSELVEFATQVVSRIGDNAQHPISFIREKIENVVGIGCAIADLTIGQSLRTPEQQAQRIQEFAESIHSFTSLPWAEKKSIFAKGIADVITAAGFVSATNTVKSLATSIPHYLPAITTAFSEGTSELLSALSETLSGASFSGGAGAAEVIASQEVIAESIAQVADGFAVAIAADDSAALSLPDSTSVLRQDSEKITGGGAPDVVKSQPTKTVDDLMREATPGDVTRSTKQFHKKGGYNQALDDFSNLNLKNIKTEPNEWGMVHRGQLDDGTWVVVRNYSKGEPGKAGLPTLEFQFGKRNFIKFRYE